MTYADPHSIFSFGADSGFKCRGKQASRVRPGFVVGPSVFVFGSSGLFKQVKGWRLFMIADAWASFRPTLSAAEPDEREKGTRRPRSQKPEDPRKKTGRSIRCPARIRPLHQARSGFEPMDKRTGASPSCLKSISRPLPSKTYPFRFAHARRMRPLSVGRLDNAFHPATDHL